MRLEPVRCVVSVPAKSDVDVGICIDVDVDGDIDVDIDVDVDGGVKEVRGLEVSERRAIGRETGVVVGGGLTSCTRNCRCYNVYENKSMTTSSNQRSNVERRYEESKGEILSELRTYTIMVASRGMMGGSSSVVKRSSGLVVYSVYPVYPTVSRAGLLGLAGKECRSMLAVMLRQLVN